MWRPTFLLEGPRGQPHSPAVSVGLWPSPCQGRARLTEPLPGPHLKSVATHATGHAEMHTGDGDSVNIHIYVIISLQ